MKVKPLILVAIIAAVSCGCSSNKVNQKDIIDMIDSQKYETVAEKIKKDETEINLYYRGWNDSADNITHHILQK